MRTSALRRWRVRLGAIVLVLCALASPAQAALAVDATTPAIQSGDVLNISTLSFSPPSGALLVALVMSNSTGAAVTITMTTTSGTSGIWTKRKQIDPVENGGGGGCAAIYTAPATGGAIIVRAAQNGPNTGIALKVIVMTDTGTPTIGATGTGTSTTQHITPTALTTTAANSWVMGAFDDFNALGAPTTTDTGYNFHLVGAISGIAVRKAATTPASGTAVTLDANAFAASPAWNWAAIEILASATTTTPRLTLLGVGP